MLDSAPLDELMKQLAGQPISQPAREPASRKPLQMLGCRLLGVAQQNGPRDVLGCLAPTLGGQKHAHTTTSNVEQNHTHQHRSFRGSNADAGRGSQASDESE